MKLDRKEKEIPASPERGKWKSVRNLYEEKTRAYAVATVKKAARMNFRISRRDMIALKFKAFEV